MDYRAGRSAMVLYACCGSDETLRGFVAGRGARELDRAISAGARWIRFAPTPEPRRELDRLLEGFVERFGSPPISNSAAGRRGPGQRDKADKSEKAEKAGEDPR